MIKKQLKYLFSFLLLAAFALSYLNIDFGHKASCSHAEHHQHDVSELTLHVDIECPPVCEHDAHLSIDVSCDCDLSSIFVKHLFLPNKQESTIDFTFEAMYVNSFDIYFFSLENINNKSPPFLS